MRADSFVWNGCLNLSRPYRLSPFVPIDAGIPSRLGQAAVAGSIPSQRPRLLAWHLFRSVKGSLRQ